MKEISEVVELCREIAKSGYAPGGSGNVSYINGRTIWITRSGVNLGEVGDKDFSELKVSLPDRTVELISGGKPSKELPMHLAMYSASNVTKGIIAHTHSLKAAALSCLAPYSAESALPALTPYYVMKVGELPLVSYAKPGSTAQAEQIFRMGTKSQRILLQNHGPAVLTENASQAMAALHEIENTAAIWLQIKNFENVHTLNKLEINELLNIENGNKGRSDD